MKISEIEKIVEKETSEAAKRIDATLVSAFSDSQAPLEEYLAVLSASIIRETVTIVFRTLTQAGVLNPETDD